MFFDDNFKEMTQDIFTVLNFVGTLYLFLDISVYGNVISIAPHFTSRALLVYPKIILIITPWLFSIFIFPDPIKSIKSSPYACNGLPEHGVYQRPYKQYFFNVTLYVKGFCFEYTIPLIIELKLFLMHLIFSLHFFRVKREIICIYIYI